MNRKGFTLVELLAVIIVLGVIAGISVVSINYGLEQARKETENVYVKTLRDAISVYLNSEGKELKYTTKACVATKLLGTSEVYESDTITFRKITESDFKPLAESDFVNPANEEKKCNLDAEIRVFRDEDYVYYYLFNGSDLECLEENDDEIISNLPDGCNL